MAYGAAGGWNWARQTLCLNQTHPHVSHRAGVEGSNCDQPLDKGRHLIMPVLEE